MKKFSKAILCVLSMALVALVCVTLVACGEEEKPTMPAAALSFCKAKDSSDGYATVYMPEDGDFKILVLSDPQVDTLEKYKLVGSLGNDKTYEFIEDFVSQTVPDFVVINGDLVMNDNLDYSVPLFKRYAEIFERICIPWTFAFGNHDLDGRYIDPDATIDDRYAQCSKQVLIDYFDENYEHCLMNSDSACEDGAGNHFVNVRKRNGELVYTLCLFDCVFNQTTQSIESVPTANQVGWYENTIKKLSDTVYGEDRAEDEVVKSMIFNHVGIPEFYKAWKEAWNDGNPTENYRYGHYFDGNYTKNYGTMPEGERIFSVAKKLKSTTAIFMCHHHDNDFSVDYEGIRLTFGQHSGFSHNYRTQQSFEKNELGIELKTKLSYWKNIDFSRIDDYGDERGGTTVTITQDGNFDVAQTIARNVMNNYFDKYYIDYDAVAKSLDENPLYNGTVARGTERKWKKA